MRRLPFVVMLLAGCGGASPAGPGAPLDATVAVEPAEVGIGDTVTITVRVVNPSATPLTLQFRNTCILAFEVRDGDGNAVAPNVGCGQAITDHTFPPGASEAVFRYQVGSEDFPITAGTWAVYGGVGRPLPVESEPAFLVVVLGLD